MTMEDKIERDLRKIKSEDILSLSKEELVARIIQLEASVTQLKNVIKKSGDVKDGKSSGNNRTFDFSKYNKRHVALKITYLGWDYQGFATQIDTNKTIEAALFDALIKTRLIKSRETSCYHRCGRTDKGVSAFSQVISIDLRSNLCEGKGIKLSDAAATNQKHGEDKQEEIPYVHILNKVLPQEIRVIAWCPVEHDFSARFSCDSRTYKYFFPRGNLDIELMQSTSQQLIGEHDFRNLCKMDVANGVVSYKRKIISVDIRPVKLDDKSLNLCMTESVENSKTENESSYELYELTVCGMAFLWHQIRCIVAILFLIGQHREDPQIIQELLDVAKHPRKPQYTMASELPLVLFDCQFEDVNWIYEKGALSEVIAHFQTLWTKHAVRETMLKRMLVELEPIHETMNDNESEVTINQQVDCLMPGNKPKIYKRLLEREKCEGLEERIEFYAKKKRFNNKSAQETTSSS